MFISLEGIDKSGKTTQAKLLAQWLEKNGQKVVITCEPGGTELGKKIKNILLQGSHSLSKVAELFLYLTDREQHVMEVIKPALVEAKAVISDRFADASLAYQGYGRGLDLDWIEELNEMVTQGITPDLTILLDISVKSLKKRCGNDLDRIEREGEKFYQKVRQGYLKLARENPERIKVVDGGKSVEEVHKNIIKLINRCGVSL